MMAGLKRGRSNEPQLRARISQRNKNKAEEKNRCAVRSGLGTCAISNPFGLQSAQGGATESESRRISA
jgi:hypothetical protein